MGLAKRFNVDQIFNLLSPPPVAKRLPEGWASMQYIADRAFTGDGALFAVEEVDGITSSLFGIAEE